MTKADRKKLIAERAAALKDMQYATYWLTRDTLDGMRDSVMPDVSVWLARPHRIKALDGTVSWCALKADGTTALYGTWTTQQCLLACHVYPDSPRMSIRVGDEPVPEAAPAVAS